MKVFRIAILALIPFTGMLAQPGSNLGQVEISVTDRYKAQVGEAEKYSTFPRFEDTTTGKLPVQYRIVSQPIEVSYKPEEISPARIVQVPVEDIRNGMAKLGFGLYVTPLVEAYWNSGRSSDQSYGFWGKHFSTVNGVKETVYKNNGMSNNELGAYYKHFYRHFKWETQASASFDKYSYYGIDRFADSLVSLQEAIEGTDPDHNWYRQFQLQSSVEGEKAGDLGWMDRMGVRYYNFSDAFYSNENYFRLNSDWEVPTGEKPLNVILNATYYKTLFDSILSGSQSYFTVRAHPRMSVTVGDLLFDFGVNLYANDYQSDFTGGSFKMHFFPDIRFEYPFVQDVLSAYAGVNGQLEHNSYRELTRNNPYVIPGQILRPTRTTKIFVGLEGIVSSTTSFNVSGGFMQQNDLALFYRDPFYRTLHNLDSLPPALDVLYDNSETFFVRGELSIDVKNNLTTSLFGELRAYNTAVQEKAWHRPALIAGLRADYTFRNKFKLKSKIDYVGKRYAFAADANPGIDHTLPAYLDAGAGLEFLYNSRLSFFLDVNNILNQKYDLYLGYKAQSIGFIMGFGYKF